MAAGQDNPFHAKSALRTKLRTRRARASAARAAEAGAALATRFIDRFGAGMDGKVVAAYWPMRDEIDVRPLVGLVSSRSAICALPVMSGKADPLIFRRWRPGDELVDASFGVKEPLASAPPIAPDIVIVPLLGFDAAGNRLGYGGGYYDRTLASLRAAGRVLAVGVGYDEQETDRIPVHAGDMPLDMILTDRRTIVPGKTERTD